MSTPFGQIAWTDLTVDDADRISDFYAAVVGWKKEPVPMGGGSYADYNMVVPGSGASAAGICHARGANAGLSAQWLVYVPVPDLDASLAAVAAGGGRVLRPATDAGTYGRFAVIADPAGAIMALTEPPK